MTTDVGFRRDEVESRSEKGLEDLEGKLADAVADCVATTDETARQEVARHLCVALEFVSNARLH